MRVAFDNLFVAPKERSFAQSEHLFDPMRLGRLSRLWPLTSS